MIRLVGTSELGTPIQIGSRLEPLLDQYLIDSWDGGARLRLHHPQPQEVALLLDRPWEGNGCNWITVFPHENRFRMYYRGSAYRISTTEQQAELIKIHPDWVCVAESGDGIRWERAAVGQFPIGGSLEHNVVWQGHGRQQIGVQGFAPFRDENPACEPAARFKAVGAMRQGNPGQAVRSGVPGRVDLVAAPGGAHHHHWPLRLPEPRVLGPAPGGVPRLRQRLSWRPPWWQPRYPHRHITGFRYLERAGVAGVSGGASRSAVPQPDHSVLPGASRLRGLPHPVRRDWSRLESGSRGVTRRGGPSPVVCGQPPARDGADRGAVHV